MSIFNIHFFGFNSLRLAITIFFRFKRQLSPLSTGAGDEIRTRDIQLGRLKLYQLSYSRSNDYRHNSRHIDTSEVMKKIPLILKTYINFAGSHVVIVDPEVCAEISYIRLFYRLVVGGGFEPP